MRTAILTLTSALLATGLLCLALPALAQELPARTRPVPGPDSALATAAPAERPAPEVASAALSALRAPGRGQLRDPGEVDRSLTQRAYRLQLVLGEPIPGGGGRKPPQEVACEFRAGGISDKERNAWTADRLASQPCCYRSSGVVWCAQRQVSVEHQSYLAWVGAGYTPQRLPAQAEPPLPEVTAAEVEAQVVERTRAQRDALATCALHQAAAQASGAGVTPDCRAEAEAWDLARADAEAAVLLRVRLVAADVAPAPVVEGGAK